MHGILGYANLGVKRSDTLPRKKLEEYYSVIQESGTRLMKLLNNLLDFSRLEVGKMHYSMNKIDLLPRIHQVTTELSPLADEKGLVFNVQCASNQAPVYCDQEKISQVLRNLLFNAIKFSQTGSSIEILCEEIGNESGTQVQRISVSNSGIPIPEGELKNIFEKFIQSSTTTTGAGGTGLGLAISKQILRDHNSTIWAENGPNDTIIFRFLLAMEPLS
jgi:signal transduction histidine kinase